MARDEARMCPGAASPASGAPPVERFLSREGCTDLVRRARALGTGGGSTAVLVEDSSWTANLRWARNAVTTSGDVRTNLLNVVRDIRGAVGNAIINTTDDAHLMLAVRRAERYLEFFREDPRWDSRQVFIEDYLKPKIWSDATYHQTAEDRAELARALVEPAVKAGLLSAGYIQVSANGWAAMDEQRSWYYPFTVAQYSVTVRDPKQQGSGWAGQDQSDWNKLDVKHLTEVALEKCLRSRNPVRLEPGRYTAILEPQAVYELCVRTFTDSYVWDRETAEWGDPKAIGSSDPYKRAIKIDPRVPIAPFGRGGGRSKLGERVIDERLSLTTDPMDPELGYPPFSGWTVFRPVTWIQHGVLKTLAYGREYAVKKLGENSGGVYNPGAFRLSSTEPAASIEEMVQTTKRGVLVTRFTNVQFVVRAGPVQDLMAQVDFGYTRDGTWLIEDGKISKAIKNFRFTDSAWFALNNVEQIGVTQRVLSRSGGRFPAAVPALKVRDFSFTSLSDAV